MRREYGMPAASKISRLTQTIEVAEIKDSQYVEIQLIYITY
jgi:hypothetical protein